LVKGCGSVWVISIGADQVAVEIPEAEPTLAVEFQKGDSPRASQSARSSPAVSRQAISAIFMIIEFRLTPYCFRTMGDNMTFSSCRATQGFCAETLKNCRSVPWRWAKIHSTPPLPGGNQFQVAWHHKTGQKSGADNGSIKLAVFIATQNRIEWLHLLYRGWKGSTLFYSGEPLVRELLLAAGQREAARRAARCRFNSFAR
jgi:hypothetical protein